MYIITQPFYLRHSRGREQLTVVRNILNEPYVYLDHPIPHLSLSSESRPQWISSCLLECPSPFLSRVTHSSWNDRTISYHRPFSHHPFTWQRLPPHGHFKYITWKNHLHVTHIYMRVHLRIKTYEGP